MHTHVHIPTCVHKDIYAHTHIPYSAKFWWGKLWRFANIFRFSKVAMLAIVNLPTFPPPKL